MKQKHRIGGYIVLVLILLALGAVYYFLPNLKQFASPDFIREYLLGFGILSYPLFILLLLLSIPLPIPSSPIVVAGGFLYGTFLGTALAVFSVAIGASVSFLLVRYYGKPLLEKLVDKKHLEHFHFLFERRGPTLAFISYLVPIFPSDAISLILGLTKMRYRQFIVLVILGHIPRYLIVNSFGEDLFLGFSMKTVFVLVMLITLILIALFREKINKFFFKELHELEAEAIKVEQGIKKEAKIIEKGLETEISKIRKGSKKELTLVEKELQKDLESIKRKKRY
ncbi:hypothetical protein COY27_02035 [Candidatus Woesearchaeota archaeon CG_4_10_14_0_2_um_filter_33_13]|nr:MAG: hypothetical protein COY27_02035 [Candidatus Woesearchaeota archaeon CG_4_10_14_0_2_um_filter_33_13]